jgi:hypothetical protein
MIRFVITAILSILPLVSIRAAEPDGRLFELRTYHAAEGKLEDLETRFRDHTLALFTKHGMTNVGYWVPVDNADNLLIYLMAYPDMKAREASWKAFVDDPAWKKAFEASRVDGPLVAKVDSLFLKPTDFSPGFDEASEKPRLFEMRTYTTPEGRLTDLHARFRDHTLALFKKHGMTNLGYFQPIEGQPAADTTLVYFLAHDDPQAADVSWKAFGSDPDWKVARVASEKKAGGALTAPQGVKRVYMKPTDFSPIK